MRATSYSKGVTGITTSTHFSIYELVNLQGNVVVAGTKQGFCFEDSFKYEDGGKSNGYDCHNNGITSGWSDWYYNQLVGQWIDITGVRGGQFIVRVRLNTGEFTPSPRHVGAGAHPSTILMPVRMRLASAILMRRRTWIRRHCHPAHISLTTASFGASAPAGWARSTRLKTRSSNAAWR